MAINFSPLSIEAQSLLSIFDFLYVQLYSQIRLLYMFLLILRMVDQSRPPQSLFLKLQKCLYIHFSAFNHSFEEGDPKKLTLVSSIIALCS